MATIKEWVCTLIFDGVSITRIYRRETIEIGLIEANVFDLIDTQYYSIDDKSILIQNTHTHTYLNKSQH